MIRQMRAYETRRGGQDAVAEEGLLPSALSCRLIPHATLFFAILMQHLHAASLVDPHPLFALAPSLRDARLCATIHLPRKLVSDCFTRFPYQVRPLNIYTTPNIAILKQDCSIAREIYEHVGAVWLRDRCGRARVENSEMTPTEVADRMNSMHISRPSYAQHGELSLIVIDRRVHCSALVLWDHHRFYVSIRSYWGSRALCCERLHVCCILTCSFCCVPYIRQPGKNDGPIRRRFPGLRVLVPLYWHRMYIRARVNFLRGNPINRSHTRHDARRVARDPRATGQAARCGKRCGG